MAPPARTVTRLAEVDSDAWPFVISVMPPDPNENFFGPYFRAQRELLDRREPWLHLVDTRLVTKLPDARTRQLVTTKTAELAAMSKKYNVGTAVVFSSMVVRGIMTAMHWVSPPPTPTAAVGSPEEGCTFLAGCCQRVGMALPFGMHEARVQTVVSRISGATRG